MLHSFVSGGLGARVVQSGTGGGASPGVWGRDGAGVVLAGSALMFQSSRDEQLKDAERPCEATDAIAAMGTAVLPVQGRVLRAGAGSWSRHQSKQPTQPETLGKPHWFRQGRAMRNSSLRCSHTEPCL